MTKTKPCPRCGQPRPADWNGRRTCGTCGPVDGVWDRLAADANGCWLWTGWVDRSGYGRYGGFLVHRLTYAALVLDIPSELDLDHVVCLNKLCANPWHLDPVTRAENNRRKWALYTHCKSGHEFTPANTYRWGRTGGRICRRCRVATERQRTERRRAEVI